MDTDVVTALPQVGSTAVTATADSSVGSLYAFDTTRFSASWTAALRGSGTATTETFLAFEIGPHDVYYQLDGFYTGLLSGGMGAFFHTEMGDSFEASLGFTHHPVAEFAPIRESGPFQYSFSYTGILHAGDTVAFQQFSHLIGDEASATGVGTGFWNLKLSTVPDAGSTVMLLGMALCTLGGIARRVKA